VLAARPPGTQQLFAPLPGRHRSPISSMRLAPAAWKPVPHETLRRNAMTPQIGDVAPLS
jgi:hypothetical protein